MAEKDTKINIETYFKKGTRFVIPTYQRGYKWSVKSGDTKNSSLDIFCDDIINAFRNQHKEYFIEAVTVVQEGNSVILVDGQQRTTSLFLLLVELEELALLKDIEFSYEVRLDSHRFLQNLINDKKENIDDDDTQDLHYFGEALKLIRTKIQNLKSEKVGKDKVEKTFGQYLKENVFLLLNRVSLDKAVNTFIALNGLKALMKEEELIKSELLIKSSRIEEKETLIEEKEKFGIEWRVNEERGRLARNWDKWLYWWNQKEVKGYFEIRNHHPLFYLLATYWKLNKGNNKSGFSFANFKNEFISDAKNAKRHFERLRKLHKKFEDLYNNYYSFNYLGLILKTSDDKENALQYFLEGRKESKTFEEYAKWSLVSAAHSDIIQSIKVNVEKESQKLIPKSDKPILEKAVSAINLVNQKYVYRAKDDSEFKDFRIEYTYRFLMLLNLLEDNKLKRKFDFSIWNNRSLEHIYPKSKRNNLDFTSKDFEEGSIHCIGNLVLLYGKDNSIFGAKEVEEKKKEYFNTGDSLNFQSRNLLHSLSVFASANWKEFEIINNKRVTVEKLKNYYGIQ